MLGLRVIPSLLLLNDGLVKTNKFQNPKYVGDPINAIRIFNEKEVDELLLLDIGATANSSEPNYKLIEEIAGECFMPLTYGGGIKSLQQAERIFELGVEKISLQSSALLNPNLVSQIASKYGSQSIIISLDLKKDWKGSYRVHCPSIKGANKIEWRSILNTLVDAGAGEVLLNAVDKDGTLSGPDLKLIELASFVSVPVIVVGGISSLEDMSMAFEAGADAIAAGAYFVFYGPHRAVLITYPKSDELLKLSTS